MKELNAIAVASKVDVEDARSRCVMHTFLEMRIVAGWDAGWDSVPWSLERVRGSCAGRTPWVMDQFVCASCRIGSQVENEVDRVTVSQRVGYFLVDKIN